MVEQVLTLKVPRAIWMGGLIVAAACGVLSAVLWNPWPLFGVAAGLLLASFPMLARLDSLKLFGPMLSVRKGFRWVGPIDLRNLVAVGFRPRTHRTPAVWLLVQRDAGARFRWHRTWHFTADTSARLADAQDLRIVEVAAGSSVAKMPLLVDQLAEYALRSDAMIDAPARDAFQRLRG